MVQIDKRKLIWALNSASSRILESVDHATGGSKHVELEVFLSILDSCGLDSESLALGDILRLAVVEGTSSIDANLLFQVISEAVVRILDRNLIFWNTVMTLSSSSIPWIDFRRKLSRWLSSSGMDLPNIRSIVTFVQYNVDKQATGMVKKDVFLRFAENVMGVDCLLCLDELQANSTDIRIPEPIRLPFPAGGTIPRVSVEDNKVEVHDLGDLGTAVTLRENFWKESLPEEVRSNAPTETHYIAKENAKRELFEIRGRLGVGILAKIVTGRLRWWFVLNTIRRADASDTQRECLIPDARAHYLTSCLTAVTKRLRFSAFSTIRRLCLPSSLQVPIVNLEGEEEDSGGPSWSVTIQAVAVTNLFGIMRSALTRTRLPALLSLKAGRCVDENCPPPVLWAQSKQGKKDAQVAMVGTSKGVLQPIQENISTLEFDLSAN